MESLFESQDSTQVCVVSTTFIEKTLSSIFLPMDVPRKSLKPVQVSGVGGGALFPKQQYPALPV